MLLLFTGGSQPTSSADRVIQVKTTEGIILSLCKSDIVNEQVHEILNYVLYTSNNKTYSFALIHVGNLILFFTKVRKIS